MISTLVVSGSSLEKESKAKKKCFGSYRKFIGKGLQNEAKNTLKDAGSKLEIESRTKKSNSEVIGSTPEKESSMKKK